MVYNTFLFVLLGVAVTFLQGVAAQEYQERRDPEGARPAYTGKPVVARLISGVHICTGLTNNEPCGQERWTVTVHSDGTRILRSFLDQSIGGTQINLVLRVEQDFRPIDAFASVYSRGKFLGSGFYAIEGDALNVSVNAPGGYFTDKVALPERYSLLLHPIAADGWHYGHYNKARGGAQMTSLCTLGAAGRSVHCAMYPIRLEFLGNETITVPAGTFETEHYAFGQVTEVWIAGRDKIVIQHEYKVRGSRHRLTVLEGDLQLSR